MAGRLRARLDELLPLGRDPMYNLDEDDLWRAFSEAGSVALDLEVCTGRREVYRPAGWFAGLLDQMPDPRAPSLRQLLGEVLTPAEQERYVAHMRTAGEERWATEQYVVAYLAGRKPAAGDPPSRPPQAAGYLF